jgi:TonB-linked SusC/RagA family outer membrane protein
MKHWTLILATLCIGATSQVQAQGRITGTVRAADDGRPLAGANVFVLGTARLAVTDSSGTFTLSDVPSGALQVRARYVGFASQLLRVTVGRGETATLNFSLVAAPVQLEGLVVVAYGVQERRDLTGAIASVTTDQLAEMPTPNMAQAIQARVPGVDVVTGGGYRPGAPMNVRIRGIRSIQASNEPLYVVDGVPLSGGIEDFSPANIASIEVLKDASATAVYGSRGANGVVLITTNRGQSAGQAGANTRVTYDAQYGTQSALQLVDLMDASQIIAERRDANAAAGRPTDNASVFSPDELPTVLCNTDAAYQAANPGCWTGTDWQRLVLRNGNQQRHQLGIQSVAGNSRLSLTGTYFNQNGITPGQGYKQYSGTVSFETSYGALRVGVTATGSRSIADINGDASIWGLALSSNPLGMAYDSAGTARPYMCTGCTIKIRPTPDPLIVNPLRQIQGYIRQQTRNRLFGSIFAELQLGRGFSYRMNFGPDLSNRMDGQFHGANTTTGAPIGNAEANRLDEEDFAYTMDNLLLWNHAVGDHRFDVTLLYGIQSDHYTSTFASAQNLPTENQLWYNLNTGENPQPPQSTLRVWALRSYMGRLNYTFKSRYLLTLTGRFDGSSRLAEGHKWSFFPSVGLGWQLGDEPFMQHLGFISGLKLRGSYGVTGNTSINPYQTFGSLERTRYNFGANGAAGYRPGSIPNEDLVWERTAQLDAGVDFGLLHNRVSGTFDIYSEKTSDLLLSRSLPASTGFTSVLQNIGKTENRGWEASISTVNIAGSGNALRWTTDWSLTHNQNYVVDLATTSGDDIGNRWFLGQPINLGQAGNTDNLRRIWYDYKFIGIWQLADSTLARSFGQNAGDIRVADLNGDGAITAADKIILGNTYPKYIASVYNRATWRNFDFSFLLQGRLGYTMQDGFAVGTKLFERFNNLDVQYWTRNKCDGGSDPNAYDPAAGMTAAQLAAIPGCNAWPTPSAGRENPLYNDLNAAAPTYRSGTHWRVRNITLGYTLPVGMVQHYRFSSVRIYVQAQDPFVFTSYKGYDPEAGSASGPPSYRTLIIGATLGW